MIRGTTPTYIINIQDETFDLTQAEHVYVTFKGKINKIRKEGADVTVNPHSIEVTLSQEDTLAFCPGEVTIMANWTYANGERGCILPLHDSYTDNLENEVLV